MFLGRAWCAVVSLPGSILVVGGSNSSHTPVDTTEALPLQSMSFSVEPRMLAGARWVCRVGAAA